MMKEKGSMLSANRKPYKYVPNTDDEEDTSGLTSGNIISTKKGTIIVISTWQFLLFFGLCLLPWGLLFQEKLHSRDCKARVLDEPEREFATLQKAEAVTTSQNAEAVARSHVLSIRNLPPQQESVDKEFSISTHANHWNKQRTDGKLATIFEETGTDKLHTHHYDRFYEVFLSPYRDVENMNLLEIGADRGKSIVAWAKYFPNAALIEGVRYGVSTDSQKMGCEAVGLPAQCPTIQIVDGNQNDPVFLSKLAEKSYDVIIDDGSHIPEHQVRSFFRLFSSVRPGGLYVIEDIETNYWKSPASLYGQKIVGSGINHDYPGNNIGLFEDFIHIINRHYYASNEEFIMNQEIDGKIAAVMFIPNAILIFKKDDGFGEVGRRVKSATNNEFHEFITQRRERVERLLNHTES